MAAGKFGKQHCRQLTDIGKRLIIEMRYPFHTPHYCVRIDGELRMISTKMLGYGPRKPSLVVLQIAKANSKGLNFLDTNPLRQRSNGGRVYPSRQKDAQWYI